MYMSEFLLSALPQAAWFGLLPTYSQSAIKDFKAILETAEKDLKIKEKMIVLMVPVIVHSKH